MKTIKNIDVTALLRPARVALVVNENDFNHRYITEILIPFMISHWGGLNHFIFPYKEKWNCRSNEFKHWLDILRKFDPDTICSTTITPKSFQGALLENVMTDTYFEHSPHIHRPNVGHRGMHGRTELENVIDATPDRTFSIKEHCLVNDPLLDIWFSSNYGRLRCYLPSFIDNVKITSLSKQKIISNAFDISNRNYEVEESPIQATFTHLGTRGVNEVFFEGTQSRIIVLGDTFDDWALFWSLRALNPLVHWVPPSKLNLNGHYYDELDYLLHSLLDPYSFNNGSYPPVITSTSLDSALISSVVSNNYSRVSNTFRPHPTPKYSIELNFSSLITNWLRYGEFNNKNEQCIFINEKSESAQRVPSLGPKNFSPCPTKVKYYVDLVSDDYKYLGHPLSVSAPVIWKNPAANSEEDARKTYSGDISFWGMRHFISPGQDINSLLHGPRIKITNIFEQFQEITSRKGYTSFETVGTQNIKAVLKLWDNDLSLFHKDFYSEDTNRIFKVFNHNYNKRQMNLNYGLQSNSGVFFDRRFFFPLLSPMFFSPPLNTPLASFFSRWLDNSILIRGEKLKCQYCGKSSFYDEESCARNFICNRCSSKNLKTESTMGHLEPKFLYDLNPLIYSLSNNNSDTVLKTIQVLGETSKDFFDWNAEILIRDKNGKDIMEVDFIANLDGNLFIGECKSNSKIDIKQLKKYRWLCNRLNVPNIVFGSEKGWTTQNQNKIRTLFSANPFINVYFY